MVQNWVRPIKNGVKVFHEGLTNSLAAFYQNDISDEDAIVVRVNGDTPFLDRENEVQKTRMLKIFRNSKMSKSRQKCKKKSPKM